MSNPADCLVVGAVRTGMSFNQLDLLRVNEAVAAETLAVARELELDEAHVNVNGGAIAPGHPLGASGTRIAVMLLHGLQPRKSHSVIAALCIGRGMGIALLFER
jgi:acetyl-CoA C-acetyltransferase